MTGSDTAGRKRKLTFTPTEIQTLQLLVDLNLEYGRSPCTVDYIMLAHARAISHNTIRNQMHSMVNKNRQFTSTVEGLIVAAWRDGLITIPVQEEASC